MNTLAYLALAALLAILAMIWAIRSIGPVPMERRDEHETEFDSDSPFWDRLYPPKDIQ